MSRADYYCLEVNGDLARPLLLFCDEKIEKQIAKLVELYSLEDVPLDILTTQLNALNSQKEQLLEQITIEKSKVARMDEYEVRKALSTIDTVRESDLATQRAFLGSLIEEITLLPNHDLKIKWKF